jgi:hypothetical protein
MDIYVGIDLAQIIIALLFLLIFIVFIIWGWRVMHRRVINIEQSVSRIHDHVFRDIESEDFEEEPEGIGTHPEVPGVEPHAEEERTATS